MTAREWQAGDRAYVEVEVIERYNDTHFDVQVNSGEASWIMPMSASTLRPVPAAGEAATEEIVERAARLLAEHQEYADDVGLIQCQCADTAWFDSPADMAAHQARALRGLLASPVQPGRSEGEVGDLADFIADQRDQYPRLSDDMDSEDLASGVLDWLESRNLLARPVRADDCRTREPGRSEAECGLCRNPATGLSSHVGLTIPREPFPLGRSEAEIKAEALREAVLDSRVPAGRASRALLDIANELDRAARVAGTTDTERSE